jgi:hypothetical protein
VKISSLKELVESVGIIAILIGLIFVYFEMRQNATIARAELVDGTAEQINQVYESLSDPEFAEIYSKSLREPGNLTDSEKIQLNSFYERVFRMFGRELVLFNLGVFGEYRSIPTQIAPTFFSSAYAAAWWSARKKTVSPSLVSIIDTSLMENEGRNSFADIDAQIMRSLGSN